MGPQLYVYDLEQPKVDASYAAAMGSLLGVHGEPVLDGSVWRLEQAGRHVFVHAGTGGLRYFDMATLGDAVAPTVSFTTARADIEQTATAYLRDRGLLPTGAIVSEVRLERGQAGRPDHWAVRYGFALPAGVDAEGRERNAAIRGALAAVYVSGAGEVVGLEWDYPRVLHRSKTLPDRQGVLKQVAEGTDSTVGFLELTYWYTAFGNNMPHLDPQGVYSPLGAELVVRPSTDFRPQLDDDPTPPDVSFTAGSAVRIMAPRVTLGTPPYTYRWEAVLAGSPGTVLSSQPSLDATLPSNTAGLKLTVTDAEGMQATRDYSVSTLAVGSSGLTTQDIPLPGTSGQPVPQATFKQLVGTGIDPKGRLAAWTAFLDSDSLSPGDKGGGGFVLGGITANARLVADRWSLPSISLTTFHQSKTTPQTCNIGAKSPSCNVTRLSFDCWNGVIATPSQATACHNNDPSFPLPWALDSNGAPRDPYGIRGGQALYNRSFNDASLVARTVWVWNDVDAGSQASCKLVVAQTYVMEPLVAQFASCGSLDGNLCARYYPIIQYWYMNADLKTGACVGDRVATVTFDQKFQEDLATPGVDTGDISLFINDSTDVGLGNAFGSFVPQTIERTAVMVNSDVPNGTNYWATTSSTTKDNVHERNDSASIHVPGCYAGGVASSMQCSHMHWNWGAGPAPATFHVGTPLVPASQSVSVTVARDRDSEFLLPGPALANGETIATPLSGSLYVGTKLVIAVDTTSQSYGGDNGACPCGPGGAQEPRGAGIYDQIGLNSYFFE